MQSSDAPDPSSAIDRGLTEANQARWSRRLILSPFGANAIDALLTYFDEAATCHEDPDDASWVFFARDSLSDSKEPDKRSGSFVGLRCSWLQHICGGH